MTIMEALGGNSGETIMEALGGNSGETIADAIIERESLEDDSLEDDSSNNAPVTPSENTDGE